MTDWCTGRRLPGTVTPLRNWSDLAFRIVVLLFFAAYMAGCAYVWRLLLPIHPRIGIAVLGVGAGFVLGRTTGSGR